MPPRVHAVDIGRSLGLAGMVVFHTARDLEFFGILPPGTTLTGGWYVLARVVAGSFFFFAGVSLVLAHSRGIRWSAFWRRTILIAGAALLVSVATYIAMPSRFIYFGILHSIAFSSLIGLVFVRLPAAIALLTSVGLVFLHMSDFYPFTSAIWSFTGLSAEVRPALDLLPLIPWVAVLLAGIAVAKVWKPIPSAESDLTRALGWPGRHSLLIYLVHQPVLVGVIWLVVSVFH